MVIVDGEMPRAGHSNVSVNGSAGGNGHSQNPSSAMCVLAPESLVDRHGVIPGRCAEAYRDQDERRVSLAFLARIHSFLTGTR